LDKTEQEAAENKNLYKLMFIVSPSDVTDNEEVKKLLIRASALPVSIVFMECAQEPLEKLRTCVLDTPVSTPPSKKNPQNFKISKKILIFSKLEDPTLGKQKRQVITGVNFNMYKMMGMEGVAKAMLEQVPLQIFQFFRMNEIRPNNPIPNTFDETGCSRSGTLATGGAEQ
jgi:hypothetical protein